MTTCRWMKAWIGRCKTEALEGDFCAEHSGKVCCGCGEIADHDCPETVGPLVCGQLLCAGCHHKNGWKFEHSPGPDTADW